MTPGLRQRCRRRTEHGSGPWPQGKLSTRSTTKPRRIMVTQIRHVHRVLYLNTMLLRSYSSLSLVRFLCRSHFLPDEAYRSFMGASCQRSLVDVQVLIYRGRDSLPRHHSLPWLHPPRVWVNRSRPSSQIIARAHTLAASTTSSRPSWTSCRSWCALSLSTREAFADLEC